MNNRNELLENYESMRIGTDETFKFHCILRQSVATGAFASGHLALRVAGS